MIGFILAMLAAFWAGAIAGVAVASWCCAAGNADEQAERMAAAREREQGT